MNSNRSTLLYHLVVLCGFYVAVQGVDFPIELDALKCEGEGVTPIVFDTRQSHRISIMRKPCKGDFIDVWISMSKDAPLEHAFTFEVEAIRSMVVRVITIACRAMFGTSTTTHRLNVQMHFKTRDEAHRFRYDEIFVKKTELLPSKELDSNPEGSSSSQTQKRVSFAYEVKDVLLYDDDKAKRVAQNVIIERILVTNKYNEMAYQFHIHPAGDGKLRSSDIIFIQNHFTMLPVVYDRIMLAIWTGSRDTSYVCLVFDDHTPAQEFFNSILPNYNRSIVIQEGRAKVLFSADLNAVEDLL